MEVYFSLIVLIGIFAALVKDVVPPAIAFLSGLVLFIGADIVPVEEAFLGFANETLITIASLFVIAKAIQKSINTQQWAEKILGNSPSLRKTLLRLSAPVMLASGFVNNTPVVAMLIDPVIEWGRKHNISPSKLLIPLSYAAIFGGTLTLIGTSTNLVVSGLIDSAGYEAFSFFELTKIGLPIALVGTVLLVLLSPTFLRERKLAQIDASDIEKEFTIDMKPSPKIIGKTIESAGLRHLKSVFLSSVIRANGDVLTPVSPATRLKKGDILRFSGDVEALLAFKKEKMLKPVEEKHADKIASASTYFEVVIGQNRNIAGKTLKGIGFRSKYQAAVLAVFRSGEKIEQSLGDVELKPGDSMLVVADDGFIDRWQDQNDFLYIREIDKHTEAKKTHSTKLIFVVSLIIGALLVNIPLPVAFLGGALLLVILNVLSVNQARSAINFDLLIMLGAAIGVARGVELSGLASALSENILSYFGAFGAVGLLIGVVLATIILTELITNAAAALLVLPIAITTASSAGLDPRAFAIAVALAASLSFISPVGYQTNTMVYSAGGYRFTDFIKLGSVVALSSAILIVVLVTAFYL